MKPLTYALPDATALHFSGDFNADTVKKIKSSLEEISHSNNDIVIDLNHVEQMDSSAVGLVVFLYKRLIARGFNLSVIGVHGQPKDLFAMLHLDKAIACYSSLEDFVKLKQPKSDNVWEA